MKDQEIIEGILSGGESRKMAWRAIYQRAGLREFTKKHIKGNFGGQDIQAEDVYQDAVIKIYQKIIDEDLKIENLKSHNGIDGYFRGIVRNIWKDTTRKKNYRWTLWEDFFGNYGNLTNEIEMKEKIAELDNLLMSLGDLCKSILTLYGLGQKDKVTAEELEMSGALAVANRRMRCREKLIEMIENDPKLLDLFENELNKKRKR